VERGDTSTMRTQGLRLEHPEVVQAPDALGLLLTERATRPERPIAVVLLLELALSVALVFLMAAKSPGKAHPDEAFHLAAASYLRKHWLPPSVGAPGTESSYSGYGFSYLNEAVCAALVLAQSAYRSWVYDFQPQGRYLFPILPMLFFYWRQCEAAPLRLLALVVTALLGAHGLLSFALIGLDNLA